MYYQKKPVTIKAFDFSKTQVDNEGKPLYDKMINFKEYCDKHCWSNEDNAKKKYCIDGKVYMIKRGNERYPYYTPIAKTSTVWFNECGNKMIAVTKKFLKTHEAVEEPKAS